MLANAPLLPNSIRRQRSRENFETTIVSKVMRLRPRRGGVEKSPAWQRKDIQGN